MPTVDDYALVQLASRTRHLLIDPADDLRVDSAVALLLEHLPQLDAALPDARTAELYADLGMVQLLRFERYDEAERLLLTAKQRFEAEAERRGTPASQRWFETTSSLAETYYWRFRSSEVFAYGQEGHAAAIAAGQRNWQQMFAKWIAQALAQERRFAEAEPYYREALAIAVAEGNDFGRYDAYLTLGRFYYQVGQHREGLANARSGLAYTASGTREYGFAMLNVGIGLSNLAAVSDAIDTLRVARGVLDVTGSIADQAYLRFEQARAYRRNEQFALATRLLDTAVTLSASMDIPHTRLFLEEERAAVAEGLGDYAQALVHERAFRGLERSLDSINDDLVMSSQARRYAREREDALLTAQTAWVQERSRYRMALAVVGTLLLFAVGGMILFRKR